jgi:ATP-binding cassette, subfamily C (CFTR/MRP), member 4
MNEQSSDDSNGNPGRLPNKFVSVSLLSRLMFLWPYDLIKTGLDRHIQETNLPDLLPEDSSKYNLELIEKIWKKEKERCQGANVGSRKQSPSLHRALLIHYIITMWDAQLLTALVCFAEVGQAVTLGYLIQTFASSSSDRNNLGYLYAAILVSLCLVVLLGTHALYFKTWHKGMQYRISAVAAIYAKSLRLPSVGTTLNSGKVINLATNDVERFLLASVMISFLWWGPVQAIVVLLVGLKIIGPAIIAGYAFLLVIGVVQYFLGRSFAFYRSKVSVILN